MQKIERFIGTGTRGPEITQEANRREPAAYRGQLYFTTVAICLLLSSMALCCGSLGRSLQGLVDFRAFYAAGHIVAAGQGVHLYEYEYQKQAQNRLMGDARQALPFLYPAFATLLFVPLTSLSYGHSFCAFWIVNFILLIFTSKLFRAYGIFSLKLPTWLLTCVFFGFLPVSIALMQGQLSLVLLILYSGSYILLEREKPSYAGALLALTLIKFQIALPVAFLFLCWKQFRFFVGFITGAFILAFLSIIVAGLHGTLEYASGLMGMGEATLLGAKAAQLRYGMFAADMPNLHGIFFRLTKGSLTGQGCSVVCSALVMLWTLRQKPSLSIALPTAMLVSYHMQAYDLTLLLLPISIAASSFLAVSEDRLGRRSRRCLCVKRGQRPRAVVLLVSVVLLIAPIAPFLLVQSLSSLFALSVLGIMWCGREAKESRSMKPIASLPTKRDCRVRSDRKLAEKPLG